MAIAMEHRSQAMQNTWLIILQQMSTVITSEQ